MPIISNQCFTLPFESNKMTLTNLCVPIPSTSVASSANTEFDDGTIKVIVIIFDISWSYLI